MKESSANARTHPKTVIEGCHFHTLEEIFCLFLWSLKLFVSEICSALFEGRRVKKLYQRYACAVFVVVEDRSNDERLFSPSEHSTVLRRYQFTWNRRENPFERYDTFSCVWYLRNCVCFVANFYYHIRTSVTKIN